MENTRGVVEYQGSQGITGSREITKESENVSGVGNTRGVGEYQESRGIPGKSGNTKGVEKYQESRDTTGYLKKLRNTKLVGK